MVDSVYFTVKGYFFKICRTGAYVCGNRGYVFTENNFIETVTVDIIIIDFVMIIDRTIISIEIYSFEFCTVFEDISSDCFNVFGNSDFGNVTAIESRITDNFKAFG